MKHNLQFLMPRSLQFVEVAVKDVEEDVVAAEEHRLKPNPQGVAPNTLTYHQEILNGAICISNGGKEVTFVLNPQLAPGKISPPRSLQNETGTSSTK